MEPTTELVRCLNLGAGNDSTALALASHEGLLPRLDFAIFSDTGWEPKAVYEHLAALTEHVKGSFPIYKASRGSLPDDVLDRQVFATLPAWTPKGKILRQCTPKYKVEPIEQKLRELLGAPVWLEDCRYCNATGRRVAPWDIEAGLGPCSVCRGTGQRRRVGSVPEGARCEQWIGFAADELDRATTAGFPSYSTPRHPLIELGWTKADAVAWMAERGWTGVSKSSCLGCPYHDEDTWLDMADNDPDEFAEVVEFDRRFRLANGLNEPRYLHEFRMPLDEAVEKWRRMKQDRGEQLVMWEEFKKKRRVRRCNPFGCRIEEMDDHEAPVLADA